MKLIFLNGPSGVGKTTLANALHEDFLYSLLISIDTWRSFIQGYRSDRQKSLDLTIKYALAATEIHLQAGLDVIIDKAILGTNEVIDQFRSLGEKYKAEITEIILMAEKETVLKRAELRGYKQGGLLTPERAAERWEQANTMSQERENAVIIKTDGLTSEEVYEVVKQKIL